MNIDHLGRVQTPSSTPNTALKPFGAVSSLSRSPVLLPPADLFKATQPQAKTSAPPISFVDAPVSGKASVGTGYYPHNSKLEGGYHDMLGKPLRTLQDFLDGKAEYVSIALDKNMYEHYIKAQRKKFEKTGREKYRKYMDMQPQVKYGDTFRIPELEKKYGKVIIFKAVDTGGAFTDKGFSRVDIATRSNRHAKDSTINGPLTLLPA